MEAGFDRRDTGGKSFGNFGMAPALLHEREQGAVLRAQLGQGVPQRIELLGIDGARGLGDVLVLRAKRQEDPAEFLAPQLIDARVAREPEEPGFELRRSLQTIQRANHLDEHLLGQVLDIIAASRHGVNKTRHPMLIADNELPLGGLVALLGPADQVGQRSR